VSVDETIPRRAERVLAQRTADTLVLLDVDGGEYYTLDEVGARVWELCDGSLTVTQVASKLAEEFDAPLEEIRGDVKELLAELADEKLVVYAE
jgi:hypothetical protein